MNTALLTARAANLFVTDSYEHCLPQGWRACFEKDVLHVFTYTVQIALLAGKSCDDAHIVSDFNVKGTALGLDTVRNFARNIAEVQSVLLSLHMRIVHVQRMERMEGRAA